MSLGPKYTFRTLPPPNLHETHIATTYYYSIRIIVITILTQTNM